jgi:hypothetical protein
VCRTFAPKIPTFQPTGWFEFVSDIFISQTDLNIILRTVFQVIIILANFYSQYRLRFFDVKLKTQSFGHHNTPP